MYLQCKNKNYLEESLTINLINPSFKWTLHVKLMVIEVHYLTKLIIYQVLIFIDSLVVYSIYVNIHF